MTAYGLTLRGQPNDVVVDGLLGERGSNRRGSEQTLTLELRRRPGGSVPSVETRLDRLAAYLEVADAADYGVDRDGTPWYHDHVGGDDPVDSLLVELVFGDAFEARSDIWALVTGGGIETQLVADSAIVELNVFVLATTDEQADRNAVETNLAEPL